MAAATGICGLLWALYVALRLLHATGLRNVGAESLRFENEQILGFGFMLLVLGCLTLVLQRMRLAVARDRAP